MAFGAHVGGTVAGALAMWVMRRRLQRADDDQPATGPVRVAAPVPQEAEEPATVYLSIDGQQVGPYAPSKVRAMMALGSLSQETYFWQEGMTEWRPLAEL